MVRHIHAGRFVGASDETSSSNDALGHTRGGNESSDIATSDKRGPEQGLRQASSLINDTGDSTSMLHVHAPHETAQSWKAILTQVVVIAIGLLLALLLEQLVEYIHHRNQVAQMRVRLREETVRNVEVIQFDLANVTASLQSAEATVRTLPSDDDALKLLWRVGPIQGPRTFIPEDAAWLMMRDSGLLTMVPATLAQDYWKLEATHEWMRGIDAEVQRSLVHLRAALSGTQDRPLHAQQAQMLREAFNEYTENLRAFAAALKSLGRQYNRVLAGQSLDFKDLVREDAGVPVYQ